MGMYKYAAMEIPIWSSTLGDNTSGALTPGKHHKLALWDFSKHSGKATNEYSSPYIFSGGPNGLYDRGTAYASVIALIFPLQTSINFFVLC